ESNAGAKKHRREVDVDFIEEVRIQQLLDGIGAMDPNGLSGGRSSRLVHGALDAVGHEVDRRIRSRPSGGHVVGEYTGWSPRVVAVPAVGECERAATGEHGAKPGREGARVLGARRGPLERHGVRPASVEFDVPRREVPVEHFGYAVVE